jgi:hypothetical protein
MSAMKYLLLAGTAALAAALPIAHAQSVDTSIGKLDRARVNEANDVAYWH